MVSESFRLNSEDNFIKKANIIHNNKYDYSLVNFKEMKIKVDIICPLHGIFSQRPSDHTSKRMCGCIKCFRDRDKRTLSQFIAESLAVHGNKYLYNNSDYKGCDIKIEIKCRDHGIFYQTPSKHINLKQGCRKCGNISSKIKQSKTFDNFLNESKLIHGSRYEYSRESFIGYKRKIDILCSAHGLFSQTPDKHINRKQGCPICKQSHGERELRNFLIYNNIEFIPQKKFDGCKYKRHLKFDFYLVEYNICLEYNGEQHYERYRFERDDDGINIRNIRDQIKVNYCKDNNILLFIIKYDEDINKRINDLKNKIKI